MDLPIAFALAGVLSAGLAIADENARPELKNIEPIPLTGMVTRAKSFGERAEAATIVKTRAEEGELYMVVEHLTSSLVEVRDPATGRRGPAKYDLLVTFSSGSREPSSKFLLSEGTRADVMFAKATLDGKAMTIAIQAFVEGAPSSRPNTVAMKLYRLESTRGRLDAETDTFYLARQWKTESEYCSGKDALAALVSNKTPEASTACGGR